MTTFPIDRVREQFPALNRTYKGMPAIYLDGPGGSQMVKSAIDAMVSYMSNGGANLHGQFPTSRETEDHIDQARRMVADLVGARADEVAFGQNSTSLAFSISRALSKQWREGDEIVVSEIDHRANVDPWLTAANDKNLKVRWLKADTEALTLDLTDMEKTINENTRIVAVTLASNAVGTITNIEKIAKQAKKVGAILIVDAVHAVPHFAVDRDQIDADIILCSAYKFFGPHVGIAIIRKELFEKLDAYKLDPAPGNTPDKLETGTQNHEGIAAIKPAIEFIEQLGMGTTRRERIISGYKTIEAHENQLANMIRTGLSSIPIVTLYQSSDEIPKTPTIAFRINGIAPTEFCQRLAEEHAIFIADGNFYASTLADKLNLNDKGGWIRAGLAPYNTVEEVEKFLLAVQQITRSAIKY